MSILSFILYCVIVTFTPGPSNIVILSIANQEGTATNFSMCAAWKIWCFSRLSSQLPELCR
nr:hypothetical protein [Paenibacillus sp. SGZ-1009]